LKDEITGNAHPTTSGIMYVSLTKLSREESPAGELAAFLLGKITEPISEIMKTISETFNTSFEAFKTDKEVVKVLSARERGWNEGLVEGREEGKIKGMVIGANKLAELIKSGLSVDEALLKVNEDQYVLVESQ